MHVTLDMLAITLEVAFLETFHPGLQQTDSLLACCCLDPAPGLFVFTAESSTSI